MNDHKRPDEVVLLKSDSPPSSADTPDSLPSDQVMRDTDLELHHVSPRILLTSGDRGADIARATTYAARIASELATSRVQRTVQGRTGTGLLIEEVEIIDHVVEALRDLRNQILFVQENLGHIVDMSGAPYEEAPAALIVNAFLEKCERLDYRDLGLVSCVLQGRVGLEPVLLRHAVQNISEAHERWELKRLAEEANAPNPVPEQMGDEELDDLVLDDALKHYDRYVDGVDPPVPPRMSETPTREPLLTDAERRALDAAAASMAVQADEDRRRPKLTRVPARRGKPAPVLPAPRLAPERKAASARALRVLALLLIALVAVAVGYLHKEDEKIRTASESRDEHQNDLLSSHEVRLRSHADTLARLVPVLAEKDQEIIDLRGERDGYAKAAIDSQDAIQALDKRVGGQVGSLALEISDTRSELRRNVDEQARQIEELRLRLEQDRIGANVDATHSP